MKTPMKKFLACFCLALSCSAQADAPVYGPELQGFEYPAPVLHHTFIAQRQPMQMAYLDYQPAKPTGQAVVLMHGKNFCAATWHDTALVLQKAGLRVIVPDQIGFCKSSKPDGYDYRFEDLADNTRGLLKSLKIKQITLVGHSMGGMLATRYALMFPKEVSQLVLVNPLGLEDWKALGVPMPTLEQWHAREQTVTDERMRNYQQSTYYANEWKPAYEPWVQMLAGMYRGPGKATVAWHSALTYMMIVEQPVLNEFANIQVPTLLLIGEKDNTAIGKDLAPEPLKSSLGNYRALSLKAVKTIPGSRLVLFPDLGHAPHIQNPDRFHTALLNSLVALEKD
jgi:pimeloyl-ACP methyl ester carboxylesterase